MTNRWRNQPGHADDASRLSRTRVAEVWAIPADANLLFNQPRTPQADGEMEALTRELVDAAIACQGRYICPIGCMRRGSSFIGRIRGRGSFSKGSGGLIRMGYFRASFSSSMGKGMEVGHKPRRAC